MRRRTFIAGVSTTAAWPFGTRAQDNKPVIGFLSARSAGEAAYLVTAFHRGLGEIGYVEGKNVVIEYRWANAQYDKLPAMAADLVGRSVSVIVAVGGEPSALAAKAATSTIPIVFSTGADPVGIGLVAGLNRPGGNATGVSLIVTQLEAKRFGLLRELRPPPQTIAVLVNPTSPNAVGQVKEISAAAHTAGQAIFTTNANDDRSLDEAFAVIIQKQAGALIVTADPFFTNRRDRLVAAAAVAAIPTMYSNRDYVVVGGLMAYGPNFAEGYQRIGVYTGRVLRGVRPEELPVEQSTKFELTINLKTAKALGLTFPSGVFSIADEVIE